MIEARVDPVRLPLLRIIIYLSYVWVASDPARVTLSASFISSMQRLRLFRTLSGLVIKMLPTVSLWLRLSGSKRPGLRKRLLRAFGNESGI